IDNKERIRRVLIQKFRADIIPNRVHFRDMAKIARAYRMGTDRARSRKALKRLFEPNDYSIQQAYEDSVSDAYTEKDVEGRIDALVRRLKQMKPAEISKEVRAKLTKLMDVLREL